MGDVGIAPTALRLPGTLLNQLKRLWTRSETSHNLSRALNTFALATTTFLTFFAAPGLAQDSAGRLVDAAFYFLDRQMDRYHGSTVVYIGPEYATFYPSGFIGDGDAINVDPASRFKPPPSGRRALKFSYRPDRPNSGLHRWAGVYFQTRKDNRHDEPPRNISGATHLNFWARADHDATFEFFVGGRPNESLATKVSTGLTTVTPMWRKYSIDLQGRDLSRLISGFGWVARAYDGDVDLYLADIEFDKSDLDAPRFVQSYLAEPCVSRSGSVATDPENAAYIYDNSLVILAYLARGSANDLRRADLIASAFVEAQDQDRVFSDGRLRNAYASGELIDPADDHTRLPGYMGADPKTGKREYFEDEYATGSDTGNMAWAALALLQAHEMLPPKPGAPYLKAAHRIADWIVQNTRAKSGDRWGGFFGGVRGYCASRGSTGANCVAPDHESSFNQWMANYRATEHNIDLAAMFRHLEYIYGKGTDQGHYWNSQYVWAEKFVSAMREVGRGPEGAGFFNTGTKDDYQQGINRDVRPLDIQAWYMLHGTDPNAQSINWAMSHCRDSVWGGMVFNCDYHDKAWWEGTSQAAAAWLWLGNSAKAATLLNDLLSAQAQVVGGDASGAIRAASACGLITGFYRRDSVTNKDVPVTYTDWPHIGATAWFIFAELGKNPYALWPAVLRDQAP